MPRVHPFANHGEEVHPLHYINISAYTRQKLAESSLSDESLLEEGEVDAAVGAVLDEAWMLGEVVLLAVLEDKEAIGFEEWARQDDVGQFGDLRQSIRRIGKDEVELFMALGNKLKGVGADGEGCGVLQLVEELLDEAVVAYIEFNADDASATSADEF